jgi:hypothetical protein
MLGKINRAWFNRGEILVNFDTFKTTIKIILGTNMDMSLIIAA